MPALRLALSLAIALSVAPAFAGAPDISGRTKLQLRVPRGAVAVLRANLRARTKALGLTRADVRPTFLTTLGLSNKHIVTLRGGADGVANGVRWVTSFLRRGNAPTVRGTTEERVAQVVADHEAREQELSRRVEPLRAALTRLAGDRSLKRALEIKKGDIVLGVRLDADGMQGTALVLDEGGLEERRVRLIGETWQFRALGFHDDRARLSASLLKSWAAGLTPEAIQAAVDAWTIGFPDRQQQLNRLLQPRGTAPPEK